jgi:hypothetical protein
MTITGDFRQRHHPVKRITHADRLEPQQSQQRGLTGYESLGGYAVRHPQPCRTAGSCGRTGCRRQADGALLSESLPTGSRGDMVSTLEAAPDPARGVFVRDRSRGKPRRRSAAGPDVPHRGTSGSCIDDLWLWDRASGRVTVAGTEVGLLLYGLTGGR